ncbi:MAG: nuclear transport factor 2 family protein [Methylotenera sp.]|nr:nuclear transport factor 2 family protein [Oligoflexia bacterium]
MKHPHALVLEKIYADFAKGDIKSILAACSEKMTFQVSGKSRLAGKFDRSNFEKDFALKLMELSGGTFKMEVHDILASDQHAVVLASDHLIRDGKETMYRTAHVWRFEGGKPVAWYEYPRDLYQFDAIWS